MGYPAMVRPPGMSLATPPPPMQASMNSAAALASDAGGNPHGDAPPNVMSPEEIYRLAAPQPAPTGAAVDSSVPPAPGYLNSTGASPSAPPSSDPRPYDAMVNAMTGNFGPGRRATPSPTPRPAPGARAAATAQASTSAQPAGPNRTPGAPNLGYYVPTTGNARGATYVPGAWPGGGQAPAAAAPAPAPAAAAPASAPSGSFDQATINRGVANFPGHWALSQDQLAAYMKTQPWLQNLGGAAGQQMTPAQLTSAVRRPNWWRQYT
jgi:hypothetical protein